MTNRSGIRRAAPYLALGAAAAYLYYVAANIQYSARAGTLGPDFWPKLILALIVAACAYEVVKILVLRSAAEVGGVLEELAGESLEHPQESAQPAAPAKPRPWLLVGGIALTSAYVALVQKLGFFSATVPYLALFIALGGYRRWGIIAATSVLGTLLMFFFFMKVVYVSLPLGVPPFQSVTLLLMQLFGIR
jgi:putative tricarboxylic transport membrane protein